MRKGRILVVDDSSTVRASVARALYQSGDFEVVAECGDGFAALKALVDAKPDLVVCDLEMPHCGGRELLRMKAVREDVRDIPVIILTSATDLTLKVSLLEGGAADYVTKPFAPRELLARVGIHSRMRLMQEELREANERLNDLACTDSMLGIYNRRHLDRTLEAEVARHVRYRVPFSVLFVDVDHFKRVNDAHGHATGDAVLSDIATTLKSMVRRADTVARYGGEEICVILSNTASEGAMVLAERLRVAVAAHCHEDPTGGTFRVTVSFGVAVAEKLEPNLTTRQMLARADLALYAAKERGRNRVVVWSQQLEVRPRSMPEVA